MRVGVVGRCPTARRCRLMHTHLIIEAWLRGFALLPGASCFKIVLLCSFGKKPATGVGVVVNARFFLVCFAGTLAVRRKLFSCDHCALAFLEEL